MEDASELIALLSPKGDGWNPDIPSSAQSSCLYYGVEVKDEAPSWYQTKKRTGSEDKWNESLGGLRPCPVSVVTIGECVNGIDKDPRGNRGLQLYFTAPWRELG